MEQASYRIHIIHYTTAIKTHHTPKISSKAMWSTIIGRLAALVAIYMERRITIVI